jgi:hypothetical protein
MAASCKLALFSVLIGVAEQAEIYEIPNRRIL